MNVVLLSGGSGRRLWPLSNEIRSKQFIRMFENGQGKLESMVERVYRQLRGALEDVRIVVATGEAQRSAIVNQLGDQVAVCVEPCRRDTFPAIVLAAAYLKYEMQAADDECIIICPVDPYVDDSYFRAFAELGRLTQQAQGGLTLMGIEPDSPSDKYGYIIPETADQVSRVKSFKEKPDEQHARVLLEQGALWNAGVFALRLGWLMRRAHELIDFEDYHDLYAKYETLEKISFDYAVVEHERNIRVLRYGGEWKDIGTWSTITEVMPKAAVGYTVMDEFCRNVHAVNELGIPMLIMGAKDMIVAAGADGILIADKEKSGGMKPYVERFDGEARFVEETWGSRTVLDVRQGMQTARLEIKPGEKINRKAERLLTWTAASGRGSIAVNGVRKAFSAGDAEVISAGSSIELYAHSTRTLIEVRLDVTKK